MFAKQLTVFIENRAGRLSEVLSVLKDSGVNILSLSLADTTEFGLLRLIVDNAAKGKEKLTESGSPSTAGAGNLKSPAFPSFESLSSSTPPG